MQPEPAGAKKLACLKVMGTNFWADKLGFCLGPFHVRPEPVGFGPRMKAVGTSVVS